MTELNSLCPTPWTATVFATEGAILVYVLEQAAKPIAQSVPVTALRGVRYHATIHSDHFPQKKFDGITFEARIVPSGENRQRGTMLQS
jgi:hypothetical protein